MKITIITTYIVTNYTDLELPEGNTADDIEDIESEWGDEGVIEFKDGTSMKGIEPAENVKELMSIHVFRHREGSEAPRSEAEGLEEVEADYFLGTRT